MEEVEDEDEDGDGDDDGEGGDYEDGGDKDEDGLVYVNNGGKFEPEVFHFFLESYRLILRIVLLN